MKKTLYPFVPLRPYPNCFVILVQLRGAPTRRQRHDFFVRLHGEARRQGLVMGHKLGLCVFYGAERLCTNHSRHRMIDWLVDHRAVQALEISRMVALSLLIDADGPGLRGLGDLSARDKAAVRLVLAHAAAGAVLQWAAFLGGAL